MSGAALLADLARRWRRRRVLAASLSAAAVALPVATLLARVPAGPGLRAALLGAAVLGLAAAVVRAGARPVPQAAMAAHLDRRVPAMGDSAELLLADEPLPPLAALQRQRLEAALATADERELARTLPRAPLRRAAVRLLAGAAVAVALALVPAGTPAARPASPAAISPVTAGTAAATPLLRELRVTVRPPGYTGRPPRTAAVLAVRAEEGATVQWRVTALAPVEQAWLLVDESQRIVLRPAGDAFVAAREIREPHLVRLVLAGAAGELWRSAPARIDLIPDRPPTVELLAPETLLERPAAGPGTLRLELAIADDHGIAGGALRLTLASGDDEQVEFRESSEPLPLRRSGRRQLVRRTIDLAALGLTAGSELFVRAEVRDGRRPQPNVGRAPTVIVRIPKEQRASAALGEGIPTLVGPELLRSQRQILVDTERLVAEAPRLRPADVDRRSRSLALDQRALRHRYGVLLGQEVEDGRVVETEEDHAGEGGDAHAPDALAGVPEGLAHSHDSAESATFFPDPIRRRLVAMLAAMWDAERELATIAPRAALPHERRALELLKEVQQAARVYVARSGVETTPLDPARRLGGDLAGVGDVSDTQAAPAGDPTAEAAAGLLAALADHRAPPAATLEPVRAAMADRARAGDAAALDGLPALDALAAGATPAAGSRDALVRALWGLVPEPQLPARRGAENGALWQRYRRQLTEGGPR